MDVVQDFRNGALRLHVLKAAVDAEVHGAGLSERLTTLGYRVSPGTLYPLLHRLQDAGLLKSRTEVAGGRQVRRYRATKRGRKVLVEAQKVLADLVAEVA